VDNYHDDPKMEDGRGRRNALSGRDLGLGIRQSGVRRHDVRALPVMMCKLAWIRCDLRRRSMETALPVPRTLSCCISFL
jgi:hypothetical protein